MIDNVSIIIPSFYSNKLTSICIRSFEKFKPLSLKINYIVVENSNDISYKEHVMNLANDVQWINNETPLRYSEANGEAVEIGLKSVFTEYVFIVHCDVCVTHEKFFTELFQKVYDGNKLVGTSLDPARINATHISGVLVKTTIAKSVSFSPLYVYGKQIADSGDALTIKCRAENIPHYCFENTFNSPNLVENLTEKFKPFNGVSRTIDKDNNVIFMHLGRGIVKTQGLYKEKNKVLLEDWVDFCETILK